jgi:hypothetical protein
MKRRAFITLARRRGGHVAGRGACAAARARAGGRCAHELLGERMDAVDAVADLANRSSDYMRDPAVNVHRGLVMGNWDEPAAMA